MKPSYLLTSAILILASGCTSLQSMRLSEPAAKPESAVPLVEPLSAGQAALQQFAWVKRGSAEQLEGELPALEKAFAVQAQERNRLRLAVTQGFAGCRSCDRQRAMGLFKQAQREGADEATRTLAGLFLELLEVQAQLDGRDKALARERQETKALRQQLEALQKKLDALTSIEESLHRRE